MRPVLILVCLAASAIFGDTVADFGTQVKPVIRNSCLGCHNASLASGEVNLTPYLDPASVLKDRAAWEKITQKIESGEMPPKGVPRPQPERVTGLLKFINSEFDKADLSIKPDPGRVVAKRLNLSLIHI